MTKKTLNELYKEHQGKVSDKWSIYLHVYNEIFTKYRDDTVRLLEIGVQNGGSLEIWAKYFSQAERLIGCDINPDCASLTYNDPKFTVIVGDLTKALFPNSNKASNTSGVAGCPKASTNTSKNPTSNFTCPISTSPTRKARFICIFPLVKKALCAADLAAGDRLIFEL